MFAKFSKFNLELLEFPAVYDIMETEEDLLGFFQWYILFIGQNLDKLE